MCGDAYPCFPERQKRWRKGSLAHSCIKEADRWGRQDLIHHATVPRVKLPAWVLWANLDTCTHDTAVQIWEKASRSLLQSGHRFGLLKSDPLEKNGGNDHNCFGVDCLKTNPLSKQFCNSLPLKIFVCYEMLIQNTRTFTLFLFIGNAICNQVMLKYLELSRAVAWDWFYSN